METILIIAGVVLLIINITMVVKFFQIAKDIRLLSNLFIDNRKPSFDPKTFERNEYLELYYNEKGEMISKQEWLDEKQKQIDDIRNQQPAKKTIAETIEHTSAAGMGLR